MRFTIEIASSLAELPIQGICREFPHKLDHVVNGVTDLRSPHELHPAFYGCMDWHSSVHSHWTLIYILKRFPLENADRVRTLLRRNLTETNLRAEADYLSEPNRQAFERPYGWAWLLKLAMELRSWSDADGERWAAGLRPLEDLISARFAEFLVRQRYPVRTGAHANTAFSLSLFHDYAQATGNDRYRDLIDAKARDYFLSDADYPTRHEPSGADFLSPCLVEADLMRRVLPGDEYQAWFHRFLPDIREDRASTLLTSVEVADRSDPQIGHLDGLNLSRSWCLAGVAAALAEDDPVRATLSKAAQHHAVKGLSHVATGDYTGEHWLASFATYMLAGFESEAVGRVE